MELLISQIIFFLNRVKRKIRFSILSPNSLRRINKMKFEVCSVCQKACGLCTHDILKKTFHGYHLSLEELDEYIYHTRHSNYFVEQLWIQGPGEPTLWKHFNQGVKRLYRSGVIGGIFIQTNGLSLDRLTEETWSYLRWVSVSVYPDFDKLNELDILQRKYPNKIQIIHTGQFEEVSQDHQVSTIPCYCGCDGPMFIKNKIFYYCGPTGFAAAKRMNNDILNCHDQYTEIRPFYLDKADFSRMGNMELCRYCWANSNAVRTAHSHHSSR